MTGFGIFNNTTGKRIVNELETVYLEVEGVAVMELTVNNGEREYFSLFKRLDENHTQ